MAKYELWNADLVYLDNGNYTPVLDITQIPLNTNLWVAGEFFGANVFYVTREIPLNDTGSEPAVGGPVTNESTTPSSFRVALPQFVNANGGLDVRIRVKLKKVPAGDFVAVVAIDGKTAPPPPPSPPAPPVAG